MEVRGRTKVLSAFEEWTRDLTLSTNPDALTRRAQTLLFGLLPVQATVYYERDGDSWFVRSMLGEYGSEGLKRAHDAGLPHEQTGNLRVPFETGEVLYLDPYDLNSDGLAEHMTHVSATAMLPIKEAGRVRGILGLARFGGAAWNGTDRAVIEAVGRSLELALDRASKAAELEEERSKLAARTAALAAANEELEAFAYSVSHDLRTPVRHIAGFNALLRKSFGDTLDPKAARYLTVVDEAAQRMDALIDAMLNLSRTSRLPLRLGPVDLSALVGQVLHHGPLAVTSTRLESLDLLVGQLAIAVETCNLFEALERQNLALRLAYDETIEGWAQALDLRDKETEGHSRRVTERTVELCRALGLPPEGLVDVRRGALLHDIGKMAIPDAILLKAGPLTDEEWVVMRKHPGTAVELLSPIRFLRPALDIPEYHHEKWDGSGYPRGLKGTAIPLTARAFAVVDVFDALTNNRPYRAAWTREKAAAHIQAGAGTHFDPHVVRVFLKVLDQERTPDGSHPTTLGV